MMIHFVRRAHVDQGAFGEGTALVNARGYCAVINAYLLVLVVLPGMQVRRAGGDYELAFHFRRVFRDRYLW